MFLGPSLAEGPSVSILCRALCFLFGLLCADVTGANHCGFGPCASHFSISSLALALSPCYLAGLSFLASSRLDPGPTSGPFPLTFLPLPSPSPASEPLDLACPHLGSLDPFMPSRSPHGPHLTPSYPIYFTATGLPPRTLRISLPPLHDHHRNSSTTDS